MKRLAPLAGLVLAACSRAGGEAPVLPAGSTVVPVASVAPVALEKDAGPPAEAPEACTDEDLVSFRSPTPASQWDPDERLVATPTGHLVDLRTRQSSSIPVGMPGISDDARLALVLEAVPGRLWMQATTPGAKARELAADVVGFDLEPKRARVAIVREKCRTRAVRLEGAATTIEAGAGVASRVVWSPNLAVWASARALHAVDLATFAHREARHGASPAFAWERDGTTGALVEVAPGTVASVTAAGTLEVRGEDLALRWSRPGVTGFALAAAGDRIAVMEAPKDPDQADVRVRVLDAKDGAMRASRDVPPKDLVHDGKPGRFAGVCGGGAFRVVAVTGTTVSLHRECSLVDRYEYDVAKDRVVREEHHTPAEDHEDSERIAKVCRATRTKDCPSDAYPLWVVPGKIAVVSSEQATHVLDVAAKKRLGTFDERVDTFDVRVAPKGTFLVVDEPPTTTRPGSVRTVIRESATARRIWASHP